jgi:hypothetical protein
MFTVCVLLYGNYPELAKRVLESISGTRFVLEIRVGLNEVSNDTASFVRNWAATKSKRTKVSLYQPVNNENVGKYPLMRQMFKNLKTKEVMWFDDDSYLLNVDDAWWRQVKDATRLYDIYGCVHRIRQRGKQYAAIPHQPWYTGKPVTSNHLYKFVTGGWWVGNAFFLTRWDYPFPELHHNGGDSILGELARQQNARLGRAPESVALCHCEACFKDALDTKKGVHINVGGRSGRRGIGVTGERYVFSDGEPFPSTTHQNFETQVTFYGS